MNYMGFLCLGLGILTTALSLLCGAIGIFSKEPLIRQKAFFYLKCVVPVAVSVLSLGIYLVFIKTPAR